MAFPTGVCPSCWKLSPQLPSAFTGTAPEAGEETICAAVRPPQKEAQKSRAQAAAFTALRRREDPGAPCEFINFLGDRKEKKDGFIEKRPGFDDVTTNI